MCKAQRDGGRRCPVHRHDTIAFVRLATEKSGGLTKDQTEDLFAELRREGRHSAPISEEAWDSALSNLSAAASDAEDKVRIDAQIAKARANVDHPDGATSYAQRLLVARAKARATNLNNKLREIGAEAGLSLAQVREKFDAEYAAVDRSRGSAVPPEYTQMSRRRAVQADIPYDRSTVVALARVKASATRAPERRVTLIPVENSTAIHSYGYNEGRLEVAFHNNPDHPVPYRNVPEDVWERLRTSSSPGRTYVREIRGNRDYMYATGEDAEADAYAVRCASCGQFRASAHTCPERVEQDAMAEAGLTSAQINEVLEASDETVEDPNSLPEAADAPQLADTVPAMESVEETPELEVSDEASRMLAEVLSQTDRLDNQEALEALYSAMNITPEQDAEADRFFADLAADAPNATDETVEEIVAAETPATPADDPSITPLVVETLDEIDNADIIRVNATGDGAVPEFEVTPNTQRNPQPFEIAPELSLDKSAPVERLSCVNNETYEYRLDSLGGTKLSDEDVEKIKNATNFTSFVIGRDFDGNQKIVDVYNTKQYTCHGLTHAAWGNGRTSSYKLTRLGRQVPVKKFTQEERDAAVEAENARLQQLVVDDKAVLVEGNATYSRKFRADGNLAKQPRIAFGKTADIRRVIGEGKVAIIPVKWELEDSNKKVDDQGFAYASGYGTEVTGEVAVRRNAQGVIEVVSSERKLKCNCYDYRQKYYCAHLGYVARHVPNVAQQTLAAERGHRLLTSALSGRGDVTVVENDGANGTYISFGTTAPFGGAGASNHRWQAREAFVIPNGMVDSISEPSPESLQAVASMYTLSQHITSVSAPPRPTAVRTALRRADVSIPVGMRFGRGNGAEVTGTMLLTRNAEDESISVRSHTLKCTCADYQRDYDCEHVRLAVGQHGVFLNVNARNPNLGNATTMQEFRSTHWTAMGREAEIAVVMRTNGMTRDEAVAEMERERLEREERDRRWREEQEERNAMYRQRDEERRRAEYERVRTLNADIVASHDVYRESMMARWTEKDEAFAGDNNQFFDAYKEALDRKKNGEQVIPFKVEGGVTDGICADEPGARQFGVELEFDIKRGVNKSEALRKIGQELYAAGLTNTERQTHYHAAAQNGYAKWSFEQDCTVDAELVSPIMKDTPENWAQMQTAIEIITRNGGTATTRCGSHVHVSTASYGLSTAKHAELLRTVNQNEDVLYRLASDPSRGKHRGTRWCAPNVNDSQDDIDTDTQNGHAVLGHHTSHGLGLNFEGTARSEFMKSNIEFRMWDATLDPAAIQQQVVVSAAITDYAERNAIENGGSKKPTDDRKRIGNGKLKEKAALDAAGVSKHNAETFKEANGHVAEFLDKLFRKNEDKKGVAALFAMTNWQSS